MTDDAPIVEQTHNGMTERGREPETRNKALRSAWRKGFNAFVAGERENACPYDDHRGYRGQITFSRAFRTYWTEGWREAKRVRAKAPFAPAPPGSDR